MDFEKYQKRSIGEPTKVALSKDRLTYNVNWQMYIALYFKAKVLKFMGQRSLNQLPRWFWLTVMRDTEEIRPVGLISSHLGRKRISPIVVLLPIWEIRTLVVPNISPIYFHMWRNRTLRSVWEAMRAVLVFPI